MDVNLFADYYFAEFERKTSEEEDMASAISKLAKLEESLEDARKEAAGEAADIVMQTGAYALGGSKLKKLLLAATTADDAQFARAIEALKSKPSAKAEQATLATAAE